MNMHLIEFKISDGIFYLIYSYRNRQKQKKKNLEAPWRGRFYQSCFGIDYSPPNIFYVNFAV